MGSNNTSNPAAKTDNDFCKVFVDAICAFCKKSKGDAAKLRRADIPSQSYESWPFLARYGLLNDERKLPAYELIAASIAKSDDYVSGTLTLGKALQKTLRITSSSERSDDQRELKGLGKDQKKLKSISDNQKDARVRRLLACSDLGEVVKVLRPVLELVRSKVSEPLDFSQLLEDLLAFCGPDWKTEKVKRKWASDFYSFDSGEKEEQ